jgi:MYXO-CTERM domain-containing protein
MIPAGHASGPLPVEEEMQRLLKIAKVGIVAGLGVLAFGLNPASAVTYDLTSDHCTGGCLGSLTSGGTITITQAGTNTLNVSVVLASGLTFARSTGLDAFAFNLNPNQTVTYSNLTTGFTPVGGVTTGAQSPAIHLDGFGDFEYAVDNTINTNSANSPSSLSFTLSGTNLSLSSFETSTGPGSEHPFFIADVFSSGNTGLLDASTPSTPTNTPEPMSVLVMGAALAGLGLIRSRRRRSV